MPTLIIRLVLVSWIPLLLLGCGKRSEPPSSPPPSATAQDTAASPQDQAPAPAPAVAATPSEAPAMQNELATLTQAVRKYSVEKRRVPASLDEVVAAGYIKNMPTPPPGKKFAISHSTVILVNQ